MNELAQTCGKRLAGTPDFPLYRLANVERTFAGPAENLTVLKNINFSMARGETVAVVGSSGSG